MRVPLPEPSLGSQVSNAVGYARRCFLWRSYETSFFFSALLLVTVTVHKVTVTTIP
jgi:hypothetical protein